MAATIPIRRYNAIDLFLVYRHTKEIATVIFSKVGPVTDKIIVLSTCATEADAQRIAEHLVQLRLAACVNIMPGVTSVYRWQGAVESAGEWMLVIKSRRDLLPQIEEEFAKVHPYEVPELVALPIVDGGKAYLGWLAGELKE